MSNTEELLHKHQELDKQIDHLQNDVHFAFDEKSKELVHNLKKQRLAIRDKLENLARIA